ncbi:hypothetical protein BpHYR1_041437 [Brachionus plicatilis]|uniref:Uncharacterized protein n=1 Tax=Brachionus plicatilis TaxID=10195 RepID=A0A3M7QNL0_BRAPC|nr:hypothetical protein BpHYR1_041437 [Brachionus plicatilis]
MFMVCPYQIKDLFVCLFRLYILEQFCRTFCPTAKIYWILNWLIDMGYENLILNSNKSNYDQFPVN